METTILLRKTGSSYNKETSCNKFSLLQTTSGNCIQKLITTLIILSSVFVWQSSIAQVQAGFELDGNVYPIAPNPPDDWTMIYSPPNSAQVTTGILTDGVGAAEQSFVQGSADLDDVNTWNWMQSHTTPDKDDILHGAAALYDGTKLYFFGDRFAQNGDAQIGFWFFKNPVSLNPDGTFNGTHAIGDILLLTNFVNGGGVAQIIAYEWVGSGGSDGTLDLISVNGSSTYAITNSGTAPVPWNYAPKFGPAGSYPTGAFFEGGFDLANLGLTIDPCFSSFLLETRSSQSVTAELKDFLLGNFFTRPQATVNSASICIGGSATLTATVEGGVAPLSYAWSNGATTASTTVSPTSTTTYTVTVTGANGCVALPASGTVTVTPLPACSIGDVSPGSLICNHGNYTVGTTSSGTYSWSMSVDGNPPGWGIVGSTTSQTITFSAGNCGAPGFQVHFTLTVTANGCTSTCTRSFAPGAPACVVDIRPPLILNCARTSQYLLASYSTDIINPTFMWTRNGTPIGAGINDGVGLDSISISSPGTYRFTLTDPANSANTCFAEVTVGQDITPPGASATGGRLTCTTLTVQLTATSPTGGVSYSWSGPGGFTSSQQNPTVGTQGTYTVTVTNPANGCTSTASATVTQDITPPGANATGGHLTCAITSITLGASSPTAGVTYTWNGPGGFSSSQQNPSASEPGTYTVVITNTDNGCTSSASASVTQDITSPPCSIGDVTPGNLICNHGNYSVGTSLNPAQYDLSWSMSVDGNPPGWAIIGSTTLQTITFSAGNCGAPGFLVHFTLTVTSKANGCTSTCTKAFAPGAPACVADIRPPVELNCIVTSQYLLASYATDILNPIFDWTRNGISIGPGLNDEISLDSILITLPGTYVFSITDPQNSANTCSAQTIVTQDTTAPGAQATGGELTCDITTVQLTATAGSGDVTYEWSGPGGFSSTEQNPFTGNVPGTYTVTVTDISNGCTSTASAEVTQDITPPGAQATGGELTCDVTTIQLTSTAGSGDVTYEWSGPGGFSSTEQNPFTGNVPGTYTVTITDISNGCTSTASAEVTQDITPPGASATGGELTCDVTTIQLMALPNGFAYSWSGPGGFTSSDQNPFTGNVPGTYTVTVTDAGNGCTSTASAEVTQDITPPGASAIGEELTCVITTIQLMALPNGFAYSWSGPGGFISSDQNPFTGNVPGTYTVTVTDTGNGCTSTASAEVTQDITPPGAQATGGELTCVVLTIQLTSSPSGFTYSWSGPGGFTSSDQNPFTGNVPGTYTVTVTDAGNGCTSTASAEVTQDITPPGASATGGEIACDSTSVQITSSPGGFEYSWSGPNGFTSTEQNPSVSDTGTYTVTITDPGNGCTSTATAEVTAAECGAVACTKTQGFWGSSRGKLCQTRETALQAITRLLTGSPLVLGAPGRSLTFTQADATCLNMRMPAGSSPACLPTGDGTFTGGTQCNTTTNVPLQSGKFKNVLLGQTIALGLNLRLSENLSDVILLSNITVEDNGSGSDGMCGTEDDIPNGSLDTVTISQAVIDVLNSFYGSATVGDLFNLANLALACQPIGGLTLSQVNGAVDAINNGFDDCGFANTISAKTDEASVRMTEEEPTEGMVKAYPNPFADAITFEFEMPASGRATLEIYNAVGAKVALLFDRMIEANTTYSVNFFPFNLPCGIYFNRLSTTDRTYTNRLVYMCK